MDLQPLLEKSAADHYKLCPRQILGVRLGLAGLAALGFEAPPAAKRLLVIVETDGCFVSGVSAATQCNVGHRTLRVEDYGKTAAVFVDTSSARSLRIAPALDLRQKALAGSPAAVNAYQAQMSSYCSLPDAQMFTFTPVTLTIPLEVILSRPGLRVNCESCGEEIMNEREIHRGGQSLCRACSQPGYYRLLQTAPIRSQAER